MISEHLNLLLEMAPVEDFIRSKGLNSDTESFVYKNPTYDELDGLYKDSGSKTVRIGIDDDGNVFVWDARIIHYHVPEKQAGKFEWTLVLEPASEHKFVDGIVGNTVLSHHSYARYEHYNLSEESLKKAVKFLKKSFPEVKTMIVYGEGSMPGYWFDVLEKNYNLIIGDGYVNKFLKK